MYMYMYIPGARDIWSLSIIPTDSHACRLNTLTQAYQLKSVVKMKDIICYKFRHLQMPGGCLVTKGNKLYLNTESYKLVVPCREINFQSWRGYCSL